MPTYIETNLVFTFWTVTIILTFSVILLRYNEVLIIVELTVLQDPSWKHFIPWGHSLSMTHCFCVHWPSLHWLGREVTDSQSESDSQVTDLHTPSLEFSFLTQIRQDSAKHPEWTTQGSPSSPWGFPPGGGHSPWDGGGGDGGVVGGGVVDTVPGWGSYGSVVVMSILVHWSLSSLQKHLS